MNSSLSPWQQKPWQQFINYYEQKRLPHALLLLGIPGLGKRQFALAIAHFMLCSDAKKPCGHCSNCYLLKANTHPDLIVIDPEKEGQAIKVDQIRELIVSANDTSLKGGYKVIIINYANRMNRNAANAFLKTLEEPSPHTLIILVSDQGLSMPPTIISRCQKILFTKPKSTANEPVDSSVLALRDILFRGLHELTKMNADLLALAAQLQEYDLIILLNLFHAWLRDLIIFKLTQGTVELINHDYQDLIAHNSMLPINCLHMVDHIQKAHSSCLQGINLNKQLLLENLLIKWMNYAVC